MALKYKWLSIGPSIVYDEYMDQREEEGWTYDNNMSTNYETIDARITRLDGDMDWKLNVTRWIGDSEPATVFNATGRDVIILKIIADAAIEVLESKCNG